MSRIHSTNKKKIDLLKVIFFGALLFYGLIWRIDFFINDNWTIANTMVAVSKGNLYFGTLEYGSATSPGTHLVAGRIYGRNYGHAFLSLPFLWALGFIKTTVGVGIVISLAWSLLLFSFARITGTVFDRERVATVIGAVIAVGAFGVNAALTTVVPMRFGPKSLPLMALQLTSLVAAALTALLLYRLVAGIYGRRTGTFVSAAVILATPVAFWATIPKRHGITTMLPLATVYFFYRSRSAEDIPTATRYRALAYVPVGVTTWVHAPEGLVLCVALGLVDLATARSNRPGNLALVGTVFVLSLLPMLVTNTIISGNPLEPPRALPGFTGPAEPVIDEMGRVVVGEQPSEEANGSGESSGAVVAVLVGTAVEKGLVFVGYMASAAGAATEPDRLFHVFVRGRQGLGGYLGGNSPINLSVVESMPILGVLVAVPIQLYERWQDTEGWSVRTTVAAVRTNPVRATDVLVLGYLTLLVVMYMPRLPLNLMFTVRYLNPIYPLGLYLVVRVPFVRTAVQQHWRTLLASYGTAILLGTPLFVLVAWMTTNNPAEAVQLNAGLALAGATMLAYWGTVSTLSGAKYDRIGTVLLAFAGATTTTFVLLSPTLYFRISTRFALPVVRLIAESLTLW